MINRNIEVRIDRLDGLLRMMVDCLGITKGASNDTYRECAAEAESEISELEKDAEHGKRSSY